MAKEFKCCVDAIVAAYLGDGKHNLSVEIRDSDDDCIMCSILPPTV